jgi:hypothetical protein
MMLRKAMTDPNTPNNNSPDMDVTPQNGALEIKFTPDFEASKPVFWHVFEELANNGNGFVAYDKLQDRLVSTGKFFVGEAVPMIEHIEKIGKIQNTEHYNVYRRWNLFLLILRKIIQELTYFAAVAAAFIP